MAGNELKNIVEKSQEM